MESSRPILQVSTAAAPRAIRRKPHFPFDLRRFLSDCPHGRLLSGHGCSMTPAFEKARAWRTDEVEQRHPNKTEGDDGDGNEDGSDFIGHGIISEASREAV